MVKFFLNFLFCGLAVLEVSATPTAHDLVGVVWLEDSFGVIVFTLV